MADNRTDKEKLLDHMDAEVRDFLFRTEGDVINVSDTVRASIQDGEIEPALYAVMEAHNLPSDDEVDGWYIDTLAELWEEFGPRFSGRQIAAKDAEINRLKAALADQQRATHNFRKQMTEARDFIQALAAELMGDDELPSDGSETGEWIVDEALKFMSIPDGDLLTGRVERTVWEHYFGARAD